MQMIVIYLTFLLDSNTTFVKVKFCFNVESIAIITIQIQHLLKLNPKTLAC